jgi:arylsulfatase A-like enzyme
VNGHSIEKLMPEESRRKGMPLNIILITLDAFSYELFIDNIDNLPNLKALINNSAFFENAFSVGPSTFFAFPGIIASVYPYNFGIGIDRNVKAIDEVLKNYGYNTASVNEWNPLLTPYFGYCINTDYQRHLIDQCESEADRGLVDVVLDKRGVTEDKRQQKQFSRLKNMLIRLYRAIDIRLVKAPIDYCLGAYRFYKLYVTGKKATINGSEKIYQQFRTDALGFINERFVSPQFLWIHTIINHLPYLPRLNNSIFSESEINRINNKGLAVFMDKATSKKLKILHAESMKTTDDFIGDIINALSSKGFLDNSIIVVTADHGEEFLEEGYWGHSPESSSDRLLRVPLMFYCPSLLQPSMITVPVSTLDILPTLCELTDIQIPDTCRGLSLKGVLLGSGDDSTKLRKFLQRPHFSEAWETNGMLDRSPGFLSGKRIFTVRENEYKLKILQKLKQGGQVVERLELFDWQTTKELDLNAHIQVIDRLKNLLDQHMHNEEIFAKQTGSRAEKQRIRTALHSFKSRLQSH